MPFKSVTDNYNDGKAHLAIMLWFYWPNNSEFKIGWKRKASSGIGSANEALKLRRQRGGVSIKMMSNVVKDVNQKAQRMVVQEIRKNEDGKSLEGCTSVAAKDSRTHNPIVGWNAVK